jgi:hypothetical protein
LKISERVVAVAVQALISTDRPKREWPTTLLLLVPLLGETEEDLDVEEVAVTVDAADVAVVVVVVTRERRNGLQSPSLAA